MEERYCYGVHLTSLRGRKADGLCDRLHPGREPETGDDRDFDATEYESP